jgi:hypothetical protein
MITLPHYNWFFQIQEGKPVTNVFSGSSGTEPSTGCFSIITFDYKVYVTEKKEENAEGEENKDEKAEKKPPVYKIVAEWHYTYPFGHDPKFSETVTKDFEASPNGLIEAAKWLEIAEAENPEE